MSRLFPGPWPLAPLVLLFVLIAAAPLPARAQEGQRVSCQKLRDQGLLVSLSDRDLDAGDETRFCVVARPEEDTFIGYLANVATPEQFRETKRLFAGALIAGGYDVCRIGIWLPLNRQNGQPFPLTAADQLDVPTVCPPRVVARTEGAAAWLGPVQDALPALAERVQRDFGFTPRRPLTIDLYSETADFSAAVLAAARAAGQPMDAEAAERIARGGRSLTVLSTTRGVFMLLNLTRAPSPETMRRRLAHEYVHYLQSAAGGTLAAYPMWFLEGLAEWEMARVAGPETDHRADAARREREGTAPHLPDLVTAEAWAATETQRGSDAVYSRAASAVALLAERWGSSAPTRLLLAASDIDPGRFDHTLSEITGLDAAGLDTELGASLRSLGGSVTFYNDSPLGQRLFLPDGRTVDLPACRDCAFLRGTEDCRTDGRPFVRLDMQPGDYDLLRVTPDDRIHFPDTTLRLRIEPGSALIRCLALRVG